MKGTQPVTQTTYVRTSWNEGLTPKIKVPKTQMCIWHLGQNPSRHSIAKRFPGGFLLGTSSTDLHGLFSLLSIFLQ